MAIIAGIDEVGYGPSLGPLVLCAYAFRSVDEQIDLWSALGSAVTRTLDGDRLPVDDSKEVYTPTRGIGALEPTALSFLAMLPGLPGESFSELASTLSLDGPRSLSSPWYVNADVVLPMESDSPGDQAVRLWEELQRAKVTALSCRAAWVEPAEFNRLVGTERNKSDLLFDRACALIRALLATAPLEDAFIAVGKQGGRRMYLPGLVREFGSVWVIDETPATSTYECRERGRRVRISFLRDGEKRDFTIALASMIGKYLREGAMRLFNAYWQRLRPAVRPTSGYGADGRRFYREIEPELARLQLDRDVVLRAR